MGTTKLKLVIFVSKIKDRSADSLSSIFSTKGSDQKENNRVSEADRSTGPTRNWSKNLEFVNSAE